MVKLKNLAICVAELFLVMCFCFTPIEGQNEPKPTLTSTPQTHSSLHSNEKDLLESVVVEYITLVDIFNGGVMSYRLAGEGDHDHLDIFKMGWDLETKFFIPRNKGKRLNIYGCFEMSYCKKHGIALVMKQIPCL